MKRGFTLIELLLVVAIIGVLSAIVFVALSDSKEKAKNTALNQTMISYINAFELYRARYGNLPLVGSNQFYTCIGSGYVDHKCGPVNNPAAVVYDNGSPNLGTLLNEFIAPGPINFKISNGNYVGAVYACLSTPCQSENMAVIWHLDKQNQTCPLGAESTNFTGNLEPDPGGTPHILGSNTRCIYHFGAN